MSTITVIVSLSQSLRRLATRLNNKAIKAINARIVKIEAEQVVVEEQRSNLMINLHKDFYAAREQHKVDYAKALAELESRFTQKLNRIDSNFADNKRSISLASAAASKSLKQELVVLKTELDHLTK